MNSSPAKNLLCSSRFSYTSSTFASLPSFCSIKAGSCLSLMRGANANWKTSTELGGLKDCASASSHCSIDARSSRPLPNKLLFPLSENLSQMYRLMALDSARKGSEDEPPHSRRSIDPDCCGEQEALPNRVMLSSWKAGTWPKGCCRRRRRRRRSNGIDSDRPTGPGTPSTKEAGF